MNKKPEPQRPPLFALLYCTQLPENRALPRRFVGDVPEHWRGALPEPDLEESPSVEGDEIECFMAENLPELVDSLSP